MPQFAVYANPGRDEDIPFVVQLQSSRLDRAKIRVVMALFRFSRYGPEDDSLTPHFTVLGARVYANPFNIATLAVERLGPILVVLPEDVQDRLVRAIDDLISRA